MKRSGNSAETKISGHPYTSKPLVVVKMSMRHFVQKDSVVREIWGKSDTILFIFAGTSAEFALNKAVDWLYYTGRLPADPLGRLFSTVSYARKIVFSEEKKALRAIDQMAAIHAAVEASRGTSIPDWAYRDVLFMLIDYSIHAYELLERKLTDAEKEEVYRVFARVGNRAHIPGLPQNYQQWLPVRAAHLRQDLEKSRHTTDLYRQYRKHLGWARYQLLREAQILVVPDRVKTLLAFPNASWLAPVLNIYKLTRMVNLDWLLKSLILPSDYKTEIKALDQSLT